MTGRNGGLDLIRIAAAAAVFIYHAETRTGPDLGVLSTGGRAGVMAFFVLSGYLVAVPFTRGPVDLRAYAVRRLARIVPAYVVALVGLTLLTGNPRFTEKPLPYLLFVQNYWPDELWRFAIPAWSLDVEMAFYATLPALALLSTRRLVGIGAASLVAAIIVNLTVGTEVRQRADPLELAYPVMAWHFIAGMLIARGVVPASLSGGLALVAIGYVLNPSYVNVGVTVGTAMLVAWCVRHPVDLGSGVAFAAALTYPFYLWHFDVLALSSSVTQGLVTSLAIAVASYVLVERPFLALTRSQRFRARYDSARPGGGSPRG